jgi:glycosyltransferase A (GT-A) superfamily protein (DUF2064 family)
VTDRFVAVLVSPLPATGVIPGTDPERLRLAALEDVYETVAGLELVTPALVLSTPDPRAEEITWPGTRILTADGSVAGALAALHADGADEAAVVAPDAPDLPSLLIGKLFRALGSAEVAACPARGGGLVALAARLPAPRWLGDLDLDTPDATVRLRHAAPRPGAAKTIPGWRRLRTPDDLRLLDPGLEGWDNTRDVLGV